MEKRAIHVTLLLSKTEYEEMKNQMKFLEISSNNKLLRSYIYDGLCFKVDYGGIYEVATQISRIGNNINQIAKIANETRSILPSQIDDVKEDLEKIEKIIDSEIKRSAKLIKYRDWRRSSITDNIEKAGDSNGCDEDNKD